MTTSRFLLFSALVSIWGCASSATIECEPGQPGCELEDYDSLVVSPAEVMVAAGETVNVTVRALAGSTRDDDVTSQVIWTPNDAAIATVSVSGQIEGVSTGQTEIAIELGELSTTLVVTVTAAPLMSIEIQPNAATIPLGTEQEFTALGTLGDNTTLDVTEIVTWESTDESIATLTGTTATGIAVGTTMIQATAGAVTGTAALEVTEAELVALALSPLSPSVVAGGIVPLTLTGTFTDGSNVELTGAATWTSSDDSVATVNFGVIAGLLPGTATVTGAVGQITAQTDVTVTPAEVVSLEVSPATAEILVGEVQDFVVTASFTDNTVEDVTNQASWMSSDTAVATVSAGVADGLSEGIATITASFGGQSVDATLAVDQPGCATTVINEFVFDDDGTDEFEFLEICGLVSYDYTSLRFIVIEGDASGAGRINNVIPVGTTDADGMWVTGFTGNVLQNGTQTVLLVDGFSGSEGDDLDIDNDGVLESPQPWIRLLDGVAVSDGDANDLTYKNSPVLLNFDGGSRIPNGVDTNLADDWLENDFGGDGLPGGPVGTATMNEAVNTPGLPNERGTL